MPAHRDKLVTNAATLWDKYSSTVRCGGTPVQRVFAFDQWSKADDKLATHDGVVKAKADRERKARSGSGK